MVKCQKRVLLKGVPQIDSKQFPRSSFQLNISERASSTVSNTFPSKVSCFGNLFPHYDLFELLYGSNLPTIYFSQSFANPRVLICQNVTALFHRVTWKVGLSISTLLSPVLILWRGETWRKNKEGLLLEKSKTMISSELDIGLSCSMSKSFQNS